MPATKPDHQRIEDEQYVPELIQNPNVGAFEIFAKDEEMRKLQEQYHGSSDPAERMGLRNKIKSKVDGRLDELYSGLASEATARTPQEIDLKKYQAQAGANTVLNSIFDTDMYPVDDVGLNAAFNVSESVEIEELIKSNSIAFIVI